MAKKEVTKKAPASSGVKKRVTNKQIHARAHEIYLERVEAGIPGDEESDWLRAEKELKG